MSDRPRVAELFAGVGGFRLALEGAPGWGMLGCGFRIVWSNQWEPTTRRQHASDCYVVRFGASGHVCDDIASVLDSAEAGDRVIPDLDLLVGGAPCQDFSVARTLSQAHGLRGKKGVLFWEIHRLLTLKQPPFILLENVDRMLKSPTEQRGRDFAIMLAALADLGYEIEWRVINAADYGFPQKRRRVFVVGRLAASNDLPGAHINGSGVLARAFPVMVDGFGLLADPPSFELRGDLADLTERFGARNGTSPFGNAGLMRARRVWTTHVRPAYEGPSTTLGDLLEPAESVPAEFFIPDEQVAAWRYLKGAKQAPRRHRASDTEYFYSEGAIPFPDPIHSPSRTIVTGEGGRSPSRFKHVVRTDDDRYRRLTPRELERLMGFPDDWTDTGPTAGRRAFLMGNALVVGVVDRIGQGLIREIEARAPLVALPIASGQRGAREDHSTVR